jgi:serine/threonine-protein kinase HipA
MPHVLNVHLHDRLVGTITNLTSDHNVFTFADEYVEDPDAPVLSLSFYDVERRLSLPSRAPQVRLLPFFANLLPEGHLRQYLAQRAHVNPIRDFPLLWLTGHDLPGAVVVSHAEGLTALAKDAASVISHDVESDPDVLKFSLAGVQLKFSAIREADGGLTIPVHGMGGDWILKMPSATYKNVPENEYAMLSFARDVGIDVPEVHLIDPSTVKHMPPEVRIDLGRALYMKRFDRDGKRRVHIEDFNQIFNQYPADKYKHVSYGSMLTGIWRVMGEEGASEFVRRLVYNVAIGNGDMHLKNWSVIYRDGRTPELAPAYDYLSTIVHLPNDELGLSIAGSKAWSDVSADNLERLARKSEVPRGVVLSAARDMATRIRDRWPAFKTATDLEQREIDRIDDHMGRVPLLAGDAAPTVVAAKAMSPPAGEPIEIE